MANNLHRPLGRRVTCVQRIIGMDAVVTPGPFAWPVPAGVDLLDIVAVGPGGGSYSANGGGSGAVAQRIAKAVAVGQIISGTIGAGSAQHDINAGDTTADGMTAGGARAGSLGGLASGGDVNLNGLPSTFGSPGAGIPSLSGLTPPGVNSTDNPPYINSAYKGRGGASLGTAGEAPGGGSYTNGSALAGATGGVFFIMYKLEAV